MTLKQLIRNLVRIFIGPTVHRASGPAVPPAPPAPPMGGMPPQPPDPLKGPEAVGWWAGHAIGFAAFALPAAILAAIGWKIGSGYTAIAFAIVWVGVLFALSIEIRRVRTFLVVERLGRYWMIKFAGLRMIIPLIDNKIMDDDFLQKEVLLFRQTASDEPGRANEMIQIDFTGIAQPGDTAGTAIAAGGASAPVDCAGWYQIANPAHVDSGYWEEVRKQIFRYVYRVRAAERAARVAEIFQNAFRPKLESQTLAQAQRDSKTLADAAVEDARIPLAEIGVYPFPEKGITVNDIDLPPELIRLREQALQGQIDAESATNRSKGYVLPLKVIKDGLNDAGMVLSDDQIMDLFLKQRGFEVIGNVKELNIVAPDIDGAIRTINVGSTRSRS